MLDNRRLIYLIGVPGAGKSTLLDAAIAAAGWERASISTTPFLHEWYANRGPADRRMRAAYLGGHRDRFSGTDMLPLNVQPRVLAWLEMLDFPLIVGEGDRLANRGFFSAARHFCAHVTVVLLDTPEDIAGARRAVRGSAQNPAWLKGRATKIDGLRHEATITLDGTRPVPENADTVAAMLLRPPPTMMDVLVDHFPAYDRLSHSD